MYARSGYGHGDVIAMATDGCVRGFYRWDLSAAPFRVCVPTDAGVPVSLAVVRRILYVTTDANAVFAYRLSGATATS